MISKYFLLLSLLCIQYSVVPVNLQEVSYSKTILKDTLKLFCSSMPTMSVLKQEHNPGAPEKWHCKKFLFRDLQISPKAMQELNSLKIDDKSFYRVNYYILKPAGKGVVVSFCYDPRYSDIIFRNSWPLDKGFKGVEFNIMHTKALQEILFNTHPVVHYAYTYQISSGIRRI